MTLIKQEFPIFERDTEPRPLINPGQEGFHFPEHAVFAFLLDETIDHYAKTHQAELLTYYETITKRFPIYKIGDCLLAQAPLGAAASGKMLEFLIGNGVKTIISTGSCGALVDLPEHKWLIPRLALRAEGLSYQYLPPARTIAMQQEMVEHIEQSLAKQGLETLPVMTWTTDGFYRETEEMVTYRISEGCRVVDMEASSLMAIAAFRKVNFGQFMFTADTLAGLEHDDQDWGVQSHELALKLCFDCIQDL